MINIQRSSIACSIEDLKHHLRAQVSDSTGYLDLIELGETEDDALLESLIAHVEEMPLDVQFDFDIVVDDKNDIETTDPLYNLIGFNTFDNGFSFLGVLAGGATETQVFLIIYWDGTNICVYIPKDGNVFNNETMRAFSLSEETDDTEEQYIDPDLIAADIKRNILIVGSIKLRLQQVWNNFLDWSDESQLVEIKERLNQWLDEWNGEDRFGTEGQNDPRGDGRSINTCPQI